MSNDSVGRAGEDEIGEMQSATAQASGGSGRLIAARLAALTALAVLLCGSLVVMVWRTTPNPGLPPFLVLGEDATAGFGISRLLPVVLGIAGGFSVLSLSAARQRVYIGRWLSLLAATWAGAWLAWNFVPSAASATVAILLLALDGIAVVGASTRVFRQRGDPAAATGDGSVEVRQRIRGNRVKHALAVRGLGSLLLLGGIIAAPAVARQAVGQPHGTLATISIGTPPEVDGAMIAVDQETDRVYLLLQSSYIQLFDYRVTSGTLITLDGRQGTVITTQHLDFYPNTLVVDSHGARAFIVAATSFGIDTGTNAVHVLDLRTGRLGVVSSGRSVNDVAVDPRTGHVFIPDADDNSVHMLDARTGRVLRTVKVGRQPIRVIVAEHAHRAFVINQGDGNQPGTASMSVLDTTSGSTVRMTDTDMGETFIVDERLDRMFGVTRSTVSVRDARRGVLLRKVGVPGGNTSALAGSQSTQRVFVVNSDHDSVSMLDAQSGAVLRTISVGSHPNALAVDEHRHRVFVTNQNSDSVSVLDATTGRSLDTLSVGVTPIAIAVDAHLGHAFVYSATSETVSVINTGV